MPNDASPATLALADLDAELAATRRMLERVPDEHLGWKPHAKSFSLGELAIHIANLLRWGRITLEEQGIDFATMPPERTPAPESASQVLRSWDENVAKLRGALGETDDDAWMEPWTVRNGEQVLMRQPRMQMLRAMAISHIIHHRGQLSVYLRLLDLPVPSVYGPSADEPMM